jgi:AraC-type transcriptional regulator N-terminus
LRLTPAVASDTMARTVSARVMTDPPSLRSKVASNGQSRWTLPASERIAQGIEALAPPDELARTGIAALRIYSWRAGEAHLHLVYKPSLCVVVRGRKQARVGDLIYRYDPAHFFFTAIALPAELEVKRDRSGALVGLVLELELEQVAQVALEIDDALGHRELPRALDAASSTTPMADSSQLGPTWAALCFGAARACAPARGFWCGAR